MLTSSVRLFLKRPPEMVNTLQKLIHQILNDENEDFDLRDRAIFYCKALQYNIDGLKKSIDEVPLSTDMFVEDEETVKVNFEFENMEFDLVIGRSYLGVQHSVSYLQKACQ